MWDPGEYREGKNSGEYRKWGIRASTENMGSGRVPKMGNPGKYRKGRIRASIGEGKIRVSTGKGRIRASTGKVEIRASTENGESG